MRWTASSSSLLTLCRSFLASDKPHTHHAARPGSPVRAAFCPDGGIDKCPVLGINYYYFVNEVIVKYGIDMLLQRNNKGRGLPRFAVRGGMGMLFDELKALYEKTRLRNYQELFSRVQERDGSLSATEACAADVIYLLGNPTVSTFAETLGISQPNATYKINNLAAKGYAVRTASDEDRRECRVSVGDRYRSYYNTDYPFIASAVEKLQKAYTSQELETFERMIADLNRSLE